MKFLNGQKNRKMTKGDEQMLNMEEWYIVNEGIRIGFFHSEADVKEAMDNHCKSGFIIGRKEWEKRRAMVE